jgi:hypothetical protein
MLARAPARGHEAPAAAGRASPQAAASAAAPADPAQRLLDLTKELGRVAAALAHGAPDPAPPGIDAAFVRGLIHARRQRAAAFGADLFADPVWDMMLDLLAARLEGAAVRTSSLCIAAGVPPTTALRWIRELTDRGLFVRASDPQDGRGVLIELSDEAAERMIGCLAQSPAGGVAS